MSASKMREYVKNQQTTKFMDAVDTLLNSDDALALFMDVKKGMKL